MSPATVEQGLRQGADDSSGDHRERGQPQGCSGHQGALGQEGDRAGEDHRSESPPANQFGSLPRIVGVATTRSAAQEVSGARPYQDADRCVPGAAERSSAAPGITPE